jgi:hypothetical protein
LVAEITHVYAKKYGSRIKSASNSNSRSKRVDIISDRLNPGTGEAQQPDLEPKGFYSDYPLLRRRADTHPGIE